MKMPPARRKRAKGKWSRKGRLTLPRSSATRHGNERRSHAPQPVRYVTGILRISDIQSHRFSAWAEHIRVWPSGPVGKPTLSMKAHRLLP